MHGDYSEEDRVARVGTKKHPAVLRVQSRARAEEIVAICQAHGLHFMVSIEGDKPEDISDIERALDPPEPVRAVPRVGRNDPCPCGSGRKAKRCCPELTA
jgi:SWIM/SEC-C metal-binding protein